MTTWLRSLRHAFGPGKVSRPKANRPPLFEQLETRCIPALAPGAYHIVNLVSNVPGAARTTDANLQNPWGVVANPANGSFWIANAGSGRATVYNGAGQPFPVGAPILITISPRAGSALPAAPTSVVLNNTTDFVVTGGANSGPSTYLFATEDGTISGWNETVDPNFSRLAVDRSLSGANYKGLALGSNSTGNFLYAANFSAGTINVFNSQFNLVTLSGTFADPTLPAGFAPFNIQNIGGRLHVTYAKQDITLQDDVPGIGNGFINIFDTSGNRLQRLASQGTLNSPWGMALAPSGFGSFAGALLVGNFGDGRINAYQPTTGAFLGQLLGDNGAPGAIDGLWGLTFGTTALNATQLFFTAGINNETDGVFGLVLPSNQSFVAQLYRDLLNREPDAGGLSHYTTALDQGRITRSQAVVAFQVSLEYRSLIVDQLYAELLQRPADASGKSNWVNFLSQGGTMEQTKAHLLGSTEYFTTRGGGTNSGFLTAVYLDVLDRAVDPSGGQSWGQLLDSGTDRVSVAKGILSSLEADRIVIEDLYLDLLKRPADPGGLNAFTGLLQSGSPDELAINILASSDEYFIRAEV